MNLKTRCKKTDNPNASMIRQEYPIHISNVAHISKISAVVYLKLEFAATASSCTVQDLLHRGPPTTHHPHKRPSLIKWYFSGSVRIAGA